MNIFKHESYDNYLDCQIDVTKEKLVLNPSKKWFRKYELLAVCNHIKNNIDDLRFGICHGVRTGEEVDVFKDVLKIKVVGTDIYKSNSNIIEWDFHLVKNEWINNTDFIYSNSFDHTYDQDACLNSWVSCLTDNGLCYIHQDFGRALTPEDCFRATKQEYEELITKNFILFDEISLPKNRTIFVVKR